MRVVQGASLRGVSLLRRGVAALAAASLVALSVGPYLHSRVAYGAPERPAATASASAVESASLPHGGAHVPGQCSICRVIAQTRRGLRSPAIATAGAVDTVGVSVAFVASHAAARSPWLTSGEPRAPPSARPIRNS
jgi:hypothetical protein